jgi:hypothetical protein
MPDMVYCAHCHGDNTHHYAVETFMRIAEDSREGSFVRVQGDTTSGLAHVLLSDGDSSMEHNPSSRRNGLRVWLWCEDCRNITGLDIVQHKGSTLIDVVAAGDGDVFVPAALRRYLDRYTAG